MSDYARDLLASFAFFAVWAFILSFVLPLMVGP